MKFDIMPAPQHHNHFHRHAHQQQQHQPPQQFQQHYLTIEDIKSTRNSCWLCGCNWLEDHVSLDCQECGGYALSRPCPSCDGKCQETWTRNISATHDRHKALWVGQCKLQQARSNGGVGITDQSATNERIARLLRLMEHHQSEHELHNEDDKPIEMARR